MPLPVVVLGGVSDVLPGVVPDVVPDVVPGVMSGAMPGLRLGVTPEVMPGVLPCVMSCVMPGVALPVDGLAGSLARRSQPATASAAPMLGASSSIQADTASLTSGQMRGSVTVVAA